MSEQDLSWDQREGACFLLFSNTANPLYAWVAYLESRNAGRQVPGWVLEYFDRAAFNLLRLVRSDDPPDEVAPAVAEALEMKAPGQSGRGHVFKDLLGQTDRELQLVAGVFSYVEEGYKFGLAVESVAEYHGVGKTTVTRAWDKHFRGLRPARKVSRSRRLSETTTR
jgi:hypothetical protein